MKKQRRAYCPYCQKRIVKKKEADIVRDFCGFCQIFFYDNPLPVVSAILPHERQIALVKRGNRPYKGKWCLPSGFAEIGESITQAALRELREETGVEGKILDLVDVDSTKNHFYGDLIFITFEVEPVSGQLKAGDDAQEVKFFPVDRIPKLAFQSNTKAVEKYIRRKKDFWTIVDSFHAVLGEEQDHARKTNLISDSLVRLVEKHSEIIASYWLKEVMTSHSTATYRTFDEKKLYKRFNRVLSNLGQWLAGGLEGDEIRNHYTALGEKRKSEGFALSEVLSSLSLARKHIWEFALSRGIWQKTIDIYMTLELERRLMLFFDKAAYYITKGYEK